MNEVISKVLNGEPSLILFHDSQPNRLVLSNSEADQTVIPHDLLPESQRNGAAMVDAVACVRHLVKTIRELEAENGALQKRVQEMEKQRNWLAQKHAIACIDAACDACTSHIGDCPICPLPQGTGLCIEVSEVTFINAAEDAVKETRND